MQGVTCVSSCPAVLGPHQKALPEKKIYDSPSGPLLCALHNRFAELSESAALDKMES
jgi:hypothetical protein